MRLDPHFGMLPVGAFEHCGDRRIRLHGGGGGIPIVSDVLGAVEDVAKGAVDIVDGAVREVGNGITEAAKAVENTVTAALDDPVNTAIRATAFVVGGPAGLAAANAAIALDQGASLEDAAKGAAKSYVLAQAGAQAGGYAGSAAQGAGAATELIPFAQGAGSGFATAALTGQDPITGALAGGINAGGNSLMRNAINGPSTSGGLSSVEPSLNENGQADSFTYKPISDIDSSPISYGLEGTSPGLKATMDPSTFNLDGSVNYSLSPLNAAGLGLQPSSSPNIKKMNGAQGLTGTDSGGTYSALGYTPFDASPNLGDPKSFINNPETLGRDVAITDTSTNIPLPRVNFASLLGIGDASLNNATNSVGQKTPEKYGSPKLLAGNSLDGNSTGDPYDLERLKQLYGSITPNEQFEQMSGMPSNPLTMASGGLLDSSKTTESSTNKENPFPIAATGISRGPLIGGGQRRVAQVAPLQQMRPALTNRMAAGGMPDKYAQATPKGHKPEFITGLTGYYAQGKGTGQSDDIDAMLHDGDYVADADLVAALGDGSSKAGAEALEKFRRQVPHQAHAEGGQPVAAKIADGEYVFPASFVTAIGQGDNKAGAKVLDKMREAIRKHKRSAPTTKIPPKSKSPLEYLKMVKG